jgi:hypothetical protein
MRFDLAFAGVVALVAVLAVAGTAGAHEALTNEEVVGMVKAGMMEHFAVAKIHSSHHVAFDLRPAALAALKSDGVSERIIEAMIARAAQAAAVLRVPALKEGTVHHFVGGQYVELQPRVLDAPASTTTNEASGVVAGGHPATYRVSDRQPVFFIASRPSQLALVRLDRRDGRDAPAERELQRGVRPADRIQVTAEPHPRGIYRITPRIPLLPGEYGFVVVGGSATSASRRIFDFGVD